MNAKATNTKHFLFTEYQVCKIKMSIHLRGKTTNKLLSFLFCTFKKGIINQLAINYPNMLHLYVVWWQIHLIYQEKCLRSNTFYLFQRLTFSLWEAFAVLCHFIQSNYGECYQKDKNVKYVWSAWLWETVPSLRLQSWYRSKCGIYWEEM